MFRLMPFFAMWAVTRPSHKPCGLGLGNRRYVNHEMLMFLDILERDAAVGTFAG
jgi:hypothetical protein